MRSMDGGHPAGRDRHKAPSQPEHRRQVRQHGGSLAGAAAPEGAGPPRAREARGVRGEVTESRLFSFFRAHYLIGSRHCTPTPATRRARLLREGYERLNPSPRARDGRPTAEALREELAAMIALPSAPFNAIRWARCRADKRGYATVDGREHCTGPAWHSRELLVGVRVGTVEVLVDRGRRVALLPRALGDSPAVRSPLSLVPALVARPQAFGESVIGHYMPDGLVRAVGSLEAAGRRRVLRAIEHASGPSGFGAACEAALEVIEGGRARSRSSTWRTGATRRRGPAPWSSPATSRRAAGTSSSRATTRRPAPSTAPSARRRCS